MATVRQIVHDEEQDNDDDIPVDDQERPTARFLAFGAEHPLSEADASVDGVEESVDILIATQMLYKGVTRWDPTTADFEPAGPVHFTPPSRALIGSPPPLLGVP